MEKIKELKQGDIFNTYKDLCKFLEQPVYTSSKDKKSQLNRWKLYFNFEIRPNHSIKILEIYDESKIKAKDPIYSKEELLTLKPFQAGTIYDNYKQICTVLDGTVYNHLNHRERQMKNWNNYFNYKVHKNGSVEILEIFEIPDDIKKIHCKKKKEKRIKKPRKNSVYLHHIENILLKLLKETENNTLCIFKTDLYIKLGILNSNFNNPSFEKELLTKILPADNYKNKLYLKNFKKQLYLRLHQIITSSLNSMKKRGLIDCKEKYIIYDTNGNRQLANEIQQLEIEIAEEEALKILNISRQQISLCGKFKDLYFTSQKILEEQEEYDFVTYRKVLWIKCIDNKINTNDLDLDEEKKLLNTIMIECINNTLSSAKENHLKKIQQELNSIAFGTIKAGQTKEYRTSHDLYDELYDEANQILINRFICSE